MKPHTRLQRVLVLLAALTASASSVANGVDFFEDALKPGPDALMYTGKITDPSGKPIPNVQVYVAIDRINVTMEVHADSDGKYQTHDLRKALEMIGEKVAPQQVRIFVKRSYYKQISPKSEKVPTQDQGTHVINFVMTRG